MSYHNASCEESECCVVLPKLCRMEDDDCVDLYLFEKDNHLTDDRKWLDNILEASENEYKTEIKECSKNNFRLISNPPSQSCEEYDTMLNLQAATSCQPEEVDDNDLCDLEENSITEYEDTQKRMKFLYDGLNLVVIRPKKDERMTAILGKAFLMQQQVDDILECRANTC